MFWHEHPDRDTSAHARRRGWRQSDFSDELDIAREMRAPSTSAKRGGLSLVQTNCLNSLQEIFPTTSPEVIHDVFVAAQCRVDQAAVMLAELVQDATAALEPGYVDIDVADDEEQWDDVADFCAEVRSSGAQEEWEVVDHLGNPVRTFADVIRASIDNATAPLASPTPAPSRKVTKLPIRSIEMVDMTKAKSSEELCVKSFGARKRRFMRKSRR